MDKILGATRDEAGVVDASVYARLKSTQLLVPEGSSELDWEYKHVSNKLLMVLNPYLDLDPMKIIDVSKEQCGF